MTYPPIYIINLKRAPERKLYMQRQLDALGMGCQWVDGVDKYSLCAAGERAVIADQLGIAGGAMERL